MGLLVCKLSLLQEALSQAFSRLVEPLVSKGLRSAEVPAQGGMNMRTGKRSK